MKLEGKVAVVTGADSGIGQATAEAFAQEGAHVAIGYHTDRDGAEETRRRVEAAGRRAIVIQGDVGDPASVDALFDGCALTGKSGWHAWCRTICAARRPPAFTRWGWSRTSSRRCWGTSRAPVRAWPASTTGNRHAEEKRRALALWADRLAELCGVTGPPAEAVVPIRRAG
jgi:short chain dehydrogenase